MAPQTSTPWLKQNKPAPNSQYTQQVAQGGLGALEQARQERRYGMAGAQQNYGATGVFSYQQPVTRSNDMYDQWLAQVSPSGMPDGGYGYGRTEDGAYAGFKTQGALQAALRGRAESLRAGDREVFAALDQMAGDKLGKLANTDDPYDTNTEYGQARTNNLNTQRYERTIPTLPDTKAAGATTSTGTAIPSAPQYRIGTEDGQFQSIRDDASRYDTPDRGDSDRLDNLAAQIVDAIQTRRPDSTSEGLNRSDAAAADRYTAMAEAQAKTDYVNKELNPWLADESAPLIEQQDFAQAGLATPISLYAQRAGAEYGVDPNIVAGWYPESSALSDARDQRELAFLQETGMTSADYEQALNELERQQTGAAEDAQTQQEQAVDQYGYQLTGGLATTSQLANDINLPSEDVLAILDGQDFQFAATTISDALSTQDPDTIQAAVTQMLDAAAYTDPALLNVLQSLYKDYIPGDYDLYGA